MDQKKHSLLHCCANMLANKCRHADSKLCDIQMKTLWDALARDHATIEANNGRGLMRTGVLVVTSSSLRARTTHASLPKCLCFSVVGCKLCHSTVCLGTIFITIQFAGSPEPPRNDIWTGRWTQDPRRPPRWVLHDVCQEI